MKYFKQPVLIVKFSATNFLTQHTHIRTTASERVALLLLLALTNYYSLTLRAKKGLRDSACKWTSLSKAHSSIWRRDISLIREKRTSWRETQNIPLHLARVAGSLVTSDFFLRFLHSLSFVSFGPGLRTDVFLGPFAGCSSGKHQMSSICRPFSSRKRPWKRERCWHGNCFQSTCWSIWLEIVDKSFTQAFSVCHCNFTATLNCLK